MYVCCERSQNAISLFKGKIMGRKDTGGRQRSKRLRKFKKKTLLALSLCALFGDFFCMGKLELSNIDQISLNLRQNLLNNI